MRRRLIIDAEVPDGHNYIHPPEGLWKFLEDNGYKIERIRNEAISKGMTSEEIYNSAYAPFGGNKGCR